MPTQTDVRPAPKSLSEIPGRYISTRVDPPTPPYCCAGESVDQVRLSLQRSNQPGRYRVFDRQPGTRGVDAELIGQFIVDAAGTVEWKALRAF